MSDTGITKTEKYQPYLVIAAMFTYTILTFTKIELFGLSLMINALTYFLAIYLYYGISSIAYNGRTYLLWISGILAFTVGYMVSGLDNVWFVLTNLSMILFAGTISGRLSAKNKQNQTVYLFSLIAVVIFAIGHYAPVWNDFMKFFTVYGNEMLEDARLTLLSGGYGADAVQQRVENAQQMLEMMVRLIPAFTILSMVMQFSLGYLIFVYFLDKKGYQGRKLVPFIYWKMPFNLILLVIAIITLRFLGNDFLKLVADNCLVFLGIYYSITGLSLMEFYMRKFNFSMLMKILFYIAFFFTQLIGFFITALLGFIDSFADWRKIHQLSFARD